MCIRIAYRRGLKPSSCPIPKGNALPAQMYGQGAILFLEEIDLWKQFTSSYSKTS